MKTNWLSKIVSIALLSILFGGCATSTSVARVQRTAADEQIDLSGRWNDTDSRLVAEQMINDLFRKSWIDDFKQEMGKKPTLIVGRVRNKSSEHIDTEVFTKSIEAELINSGRIKFVANNREREEIRSERMEQQTHASEETAKRLAAETGADFMLKGSVKSIEDAIEGMKVIYYQTDMELINIETNEKVWVGTKKIKKVLNRKKTKW